MDKVGIRLIGGSLGNHTVEVEAAKLAKASIVQYRGEFYLFKRIGGAFFTEVFFEKCEPPLKID